MMQIDRAAAPRSDARRRLMFAGTVLALMLLAGGVYLNTIDSPFVFDDQTEVLENPSIAALADLRAILRYRPTRPLTNLSYALDFAWWGLNPRGYHLTNTLLHAMNVALCFALARRATLDWNARSGRTAGSANVAGAVAGGLLAAHPMMTEAVANVSGRAELLSGLFLLASVLAARETLVRQRVTWCLLSCGLLFAALGSKEVAIVQPLLVVAYDRLLLPGTTRQRRWRVTRVHLPVMTGLALVAAWRLWLFLAIEHHSREWFFWTNAVVEVEVFSRYVQLLVAPVSQSLIHEVAPLEAVLSWRGAVALATGAVFTLMAWLLRERWSMLSFGMVWFGLLLVPSAALFALVRVVQPMSEHRVYVASCGLFMAAGALVGAGALAQRWVRLGALVAVPVLLAVLASATVIRNRVWAHPLTLWEDAVRKAPGVWAAQNNYGRSLQAIGDCGTASVHYRRAIAIDPAEPRSYNNLASCLVEQGRTAEAIHVLRDAAERSPRDVLTWQNIVRLTATTGTAEQWRRVCQEMTANTGVDRSDECDGVPPSTTPP